MKATTEKIEKTKVQMTIEIPVDEFETSLQKAYRTVVNKVNIPGFRKGKAPRRILENMYGKEILLEDALQEAVPRAYIQALAENKEEFSPVSEPSYEMVETEIGKPIIFKAAFDIKPEVKLSSYKGMKLQKTSVQATEEMVDEEIAKMRKRYAKMIESQGPSVEGDTLLIDFVGKVDGEAFEGGTATDHRLTLGSGAFIPGFEDQLIGINKGDKKEVNVTFPEDYQAEELKGKQAVFDVTVKEIKQTELSPLDDEFAKDVSEFDSLQDLKRDIENKLKEKLTKEAEYALREAAINKVSEEAEMEIPQSMIDRRTNDMIEEFANRLQQQGLSMDYYLQATGGSFDALKAIYEPNARKAVRADLALEAVIREENIACSDEELNQEIEKIASQYQQETANIRRAFEMQGHIPALEFGIKAEKAVDLLLKEAVYEE